MAKKKEIESDKIIIYQTEDGRTKIETRLEDETVWLNREQLSQLFDRDIKTIGKHMGCCVIKTINGSDTECVISGRKHFQTHTSGFLRFVPFVGETFSR